ncbi:MAG: hypothetical protein JSW55_10860 [Chloroflexota bacterium]|nr:MAG: hypothetical protein JSW55_10860 [Chloroflexota bacterium]
MSGKYILALGLLLLASLLAACGTIEVGLADEVSVAVQGNATEGPADGGASGLESTPAPLATPTIAEATMTPTVEPTATPEPTELIQEETPAPTAVAQFAPAGWEQFYDDEYGIELWHPPGTVAIVGEPVRIESWNADFPDVIIEEQVFAVRVMQEEGGALGPPGPQAILSVKLVANVDGNSIGQIADTFSKRCPDGILTQPQPTTINVQLSGYRYSCEGIDGIIFNEFWSPHPEDPQLTFGAAWADMSAPLSDEILATVSLAR